MKTIDKTKEFENDLSYFKMLNRIFSVDHTFKYLDKVYRITYRGIGVLFFKEAGKGNKNEFKVKYS